MSEAKNETMDEEHNAAYYLEKGIEYYDADNHIAALAFFGRAAELGDSSLILKGYCAEAYDRIEEYEKALAFWNIVIAELEQESIISDNGKTLQFYSNRGKAFIALERWDEAIADYTRAIQLDGGDASFFNGRAQAHYCKKQYEAALNDMNMAVLLDDDSWYRQRRASVFASLGQTAAAAYDTFRAYLLDAAEASSRDDESDDEAKPTLENNIIFAEKSFDIVQNAAGQLLLCIKEREAEPILPEIFYDGKNNALLRRRYDQFIFLDSVHPDIQKALHEADSILIAEMKSKDDNDESGKESNLACEYTAKIRKCSMEDSLDSIDSAVKEGYFFFSFLASLFRANPDKPVNHIIGIEDYPNLAAVLACEEDYENLQRFLGSVLESEKDAASFAALALNKHISKAFRTWQPAPLFFITTLKIWKSMKDGGQMLRFLASLGADPNIPSAEGDTPLYNQCLIHWQPEILETLLEIGADPNQDCEMEDGTFRIFTMALFPDEYEDETGSFMPITKDQLCRIKLLVKYSADVTYTCDSGETALSLVLAYAKGEIREELVNLFVSKGADVKAAIKGLKQGAKNGLIPYQKALADLPSIAPLMPYHSTCLDGCERLEKDDLTEALKEADKEELE